MAAIRRVAWLLPLCLAPVAARADTHSVFVTNHAAATIRQIYIDDASMDHPGANRLVSQLPGGATARITYSQGCVANLRIVFDDGQSQTLPGVNVCDAPYVTAGSALEASNLPPLGGVGAAGAAGGASASAPAKPPRTAASADAPVSPPPAVPAWQGRSITKKLGIGGYE